MSLLRTIPKKTLLSFLQIRHTIPCFKYVIYLNYAVFDVKNVQVFGSRNALKEYLLLLYTWVCFWQCSLVYTTLQSGWHQQNTDVWYHNFRSHVYKVSCSITTNYTWWHLSRITRTTQMPLSLTTPLPITQLFIILVFIFTMMPGSGSVWQNNELCRSNIIEYAANTFLQPTCRLQTKTILLCKRVLPSSTLLLLLEL
jgi:hypothetical protein